MILLNKNFARADYEGLTKREAEILRAKRKAVADALRNARSSGIKGIIFGKPVKDAMRKSAISDAKKELLNSKNNIKSEVTNAVNAGAASSPVKEKFTKRAENFIKAHKKGIGRGVLAGSIVAGAGTLAYMHYKNKNKTKKE